MFHLLFCGSQGNTAQYRIKRCPAVLQWLTKSVSFVRAMNLPLRVAVDANPRTGAVMLGSISHHLTITTSTSTTEHDGLVLTFARFTLRGRVVLRV